MRSGILALLAASHLVQAIPISFLESFRLSPRWFQDSPPVSLVNRSPHRGVGGGGGGHRNAAIPTGDITFVDPSGRPLATIAASELNPQEAGPTTSMTVSVLSSAVNNGGSSVDPSPTGSTEAGMVGIVPAIGNNPGSSPPLTAFDSLPFPGSSGLISVQNSTSTAQAAQPSGSTTAASGGMVGIVPAVGNNPGSSPPLTAFPSIPAANQNTSPTPAPSNGMNPVSTSNASVNVVYTTVLNTVKITRLRSTGSATSIANTTSISTTPAPVPVAATTTSGRSVDTFPLISSEPPATAASAVSPSPQDSVKDTSSLCSTAFPPSVSTPTSPGTLYTFSPSGFTSAPTSSSTPVLVLPSIQTVSPTAQSTITISPPNASAVSPGPIAGANSPQTSPGSAAMATQAPAGLDGLSIVPIAGLPVVPIATPGVNGTGPDIGTGAGTGGVAPTTVTVTATPISRPTITVTATLTPTSSTETEAPLTPSTSSTALLLPMSRSDAASSTLTIPLPG
ncbi:hypothetical protein EG327_003041 [Venturia inaequalis]|uniref:Uncharacterized protein n=1 Tax=Venturia inaequalis TaxID=5025 RepID=A0A8H3VWE4_VENIN|nr:hypothetical protein EG327_003041 [Venturia inaequalis]